MFKILIVEDNKTLNYNYNELIDWEALDMCIVGNALNGEQGLRMATELKPDLIITDVDMPRLGGLEMCKEIKNRLPGTRFIFVSAFDKFAFVQEALDIGAYKYILKPVLADKLSTAANELYEMKKQDNADREEIEKLRLQLQSDTLESDVDDIDKLKHKERIASEIKKIINENYARCNNLQDVVKDLQISAGYANTIFKAQTGKTIFDYLVYKKMTEAKRMLKDPFVRVYEVANSLGYSNTSYFISVFRDFTGMTPKQFTNQAMEE